jgi:hypothetical protein
MHPSLDCPPLLRFWQFYNFVPEQSRFIKTKRALREGVPLERRTLLFLCFFSVFEIH